MMTDKMMDDFTRTFQVELLPPTRWDAAQAVLYRVGEPLDVLDVRHELSPAALEAITDPSANPDRVRPENTSWRPAGPPGHLDTPHHDNQPDNTGHNVHRRDAVDPGLPEPGYVVSL